MPGTGVWSTCLVALNFARCTVARAPIKKMGWDTGLKGMPKITTPCSAMVIMLLLKLSNFLARDSTGALCIFLTGLRIRDVDYTRTVPVKRR
jgi:hypothetical protein